MANKKIITTIFSFVIFLFTLISLILLVDNVNFFNELGSSSNILSSFYFSSILLFLLVNFATIFHYSESIKQ